jgi:hypothetical protein
MFRDSSAERTIIAARLLAEARSRPRAGATRAPQIRPTARHALESAPA